MSDVSMEDVRVVQGDECGSAKCGPGSGDSTCTNEAKGSTEDTFPLCEAEWTYMKFTRAITTVLGDMDHSTRRSVLSKLRDPRYDKHAFIPRLGLSLGQIALYRIAVQPVRRRGARR